MIDNGKLRRVVVWVKMAGENAVLEKSFDFTVRMVELSRHLVQEKREYVLSKQVLRSGTSIEALVREAPHAENNADFVNKLFIALKEANETDYWLLLLYKNAYLTESHYDSLKTDIETLLKLLVSIIKSSKKRGPNETLPIINLYFHHTVYSLCNSGPGNPTPLPPLRRAPV